MESDNWIIQNLNSALGTWNERMTEIWTLITTAPENFRGGSMWDVVLGINTALRAIAYALLVLFFVSGVMKTASHLSSAQRGCSKSSSGSLWPRLPSPTAFTSPRHFSKSPRALSPP